MFETSATLLARRFGGARGTECGLDALSSWVGALPDQILNCGFDESSLMTLPQYTCLKFQPLVHGTKSRDFPRKPVPEIASTDLKLLGNHLESPWRHLPDGSFERRSRATQAVYEKWVNST